jgi:hypothetical protein
VTEAIALRLPNTVLLMSASILVSALLGVLLGFARCGAVGLRMASSAPSAWPQLHAQLLASRSSSSSSLLSGWLVPALGHVFDPRSR